MSLAQILTLFAGLLLSEPAPPTLHVSEAKAMGTRFTIRLYAQSKEQAEMAAKLAFERIHALERALSDYRSDSEISGLSSAKAIATPQRVSTDTARVLAKSLHFARLTDGAFDPALGSIVSLWREARQSKVAPEAASLRAALDASGHRHLLVDEARQTVQILHTGVRLDLGGIAKGFAADEALKVLRARGCPASLVDAGGDLAIGDAPPGRDGWRIAFDAADEAPLEGLVRCGVATSGSHYQFTVLGGVAYSHIVDPKTGIGLENSHEVTVVAADGTTADALASAFSVLGPEKTVAIADKIPALRVRFRDTKGRTQWLSGKVGPKEVSPLGVNPPK